MGCHCLLQENGLHGGKNGGREAREKVIKSVNLKWCLVWSMVGEVWRGHSEGLDVISGGKG